MHPHFEEVYEAVGHISTPVCMNMNNEYDIQVILNVSVRGDERQSVRAIHVDVSPTKIRTVGGIGRT